MEEFAFREQADDNQDTRELERLIQQLHSLFSITTPSPDASAVTPVLERLSALYQNGVEQIRYRVIAALGSVQHPKSQQVLQRALEHDASPLVRHEAAFGLGVIGGKEAIVPLAEIGLCDASFLVRHEAVMALATIGDVSALPMLRKHVHHEKVHEVIVSCDVAISMLCHRHLQQQAN